MEPITILIYVSTIVIAIVWTFLSISLYRISRILTKLDKIMDYADHIRWLLETWESIPVKFLTWILKKFFK